jgi:hypothetical protein
MRAAFSRFATQSSLISGCLAARLQGSTTAPSGASSCRRASRKMASGLPTVADKPDALNVVAAEPGEALQHCGQVPAAVVGDEGVDLVDDHRAEAAKQSLGWHLRLLMSITSRLSGVVNKMSAGSLDEAAASPDGRNVAMPLERAPPESGSAVAREAGVLVVEQAHGSARRRSPTPGFQSSESMRESSGKNAASVLPPAVGASTTQFLPSRIASAAACLHRAEPAESRGG